MGSPFAHGYHTDGLVLGRRNSSVLAVALRLSCTNPSIPDNVASSLICFVHIIPNQNKNACALKDAWLVLQQTWCHCCPEEKQVKDSRGVGITMKYIQYIPRNMHMVFALLCFVVVIHWLIFPYPSGLLHWHCGNLTIAPVPAKQPWWIWINTSCEFIMNDSITTTKQSTTKPCAYFLGYAVHRTV